jgi:hypothetical protein
MFFASISGKSQPIFINFFLFERYLELGMVEGGVGQVEGRGERARKGGGQFFLQILIEDLLKRGEITLLTKVCSQNFEISGSKGTQGHT